MTRLRARVANRHTYTLTLLPNFSRLVDAPTTAKRLEARKDEIFDADILNEKEKADCSSNKNGRMQTSAAR